MTDSAAQAPADHAAVIRLWPTLPAFAGDLGLKFTTAKKMKERKSIAAAYWPQVIEAARARRLRGVTLALLSATMPRRVNRGRKRNGR